MSGITLAQAQAQLDALLAAQVGAELTVRFGERSVTYQSMEDLLKAIDYWNRMVTQLRRGSRVSYSVAGFRSCR
jgi:hypothetical protein